MEYQNPKLPEGINVTNEHPLKEFSYLLFGIIGAIILITITLSFTASYLAQFVPFSTEVSLANNTQELLNLKRDSNSSKTDKEIKEIEHYLQNLANNLAIAQELPEEYTLNMHYVDDPLVNAFATLGGNIIVYQGLIDQLDSENALAMVIAHEIAHIKFRHPIRAMGRGVIIALIFATVTGLGESSLANSLAGNISMLTSMAFSRSQESDSDKEAIITLHNYYGHTQGAADLFHVLDEQKTFLQPPEILSTHPLNENRIKELKYAQESLNTHGTLTPLPPFLKQEE